MPTGLLAMFKKQNPDDKIPHERLQVKDDTADGIDALPNVHEHKWRLLAQALVLAIQEKERVADQAIQVVVLHFL